MPDKVFVIGLDAATLDLITPWVKEGLLPNFAKLMHEGIWGELQSTLHPLSPPAWTSFITGSNPGNHGIYDFVVHKPQSYELLYTNGGMRRGASIWRLLSDAGKRVVVVNVPMTYPPEEVNGVLIAGFDAPGIDSDFVYPPSVLKEVTSALGEFVLRDYPQGHNPDSFLRQIHRILDFHRKLAFYLLSRYEWDLFVIVLSALDLVQHGYWQYMDQSFQSITEAERTRYGGAIKDMYRKVDGILGELMALLAGGINILVLSDHGAGPCYKAVFINKWLESIGLLHYLGDGASSFGDRLSNASLQMLKTLHYKIKNTVPPEGLEWLKRTFPKLRQKVKSRLVFSEIDWSKTQVYSFGRESTNLFINVKGRFPQGVVNPGKDYEALRDTVIEELMKLRDPDTGELVVDKVYKREEVYHGECLESAPDLLVTWRNSHYTSWPGYADGKRSVFESSLKHSDYSDWSSLQKGGNHRPNGIIFMKGRGVKEHSTITGAKIIDLAPTILYWMGVSIPVGMEGRVLTEAFTSSHMAMYPLHYTAKDASTELPKRAYTEREAKQIEERLRSLGYVD